MTGKKWTELAQEAWLKKQFPVFIQADSTSTRRAFYKNVCIEWQQKWPDPEPTTIELRAAGGDHEAAKIKKRNASDKVSGGMFFREKTSPNLRMIANLCLVPQS
jgi:hypothetical protein